MQEVQNTRKAKVISKIAGPLDSFVRAGRSYIVTQEEVNKCFLLMCFSKQFTIFLFYFKRILYSHT